MNAYEVLGVSPGATKEQIKSAYRDLAQQYHENPAKMQELDAAYDSLVLNAAQGAGAGPAPASSENQYATGAKQFGDIRGKINSGRIDDAETLLDGVPNARRNAEWYYLKGLIQNKRGWLEEAQRNFNVATQLDPNNEEYKQAAAQLKNSRSGAFKQGMGGDQNSGCSPCSICGTLLCLDCCCSGCCR